MKKLNQAQIAQRLGVSRAYITMLVKGERKPSKKLQRKINKLTTECSLPDTLLGNGVQVVGGSNPPTPTLNQLQTVKQNLLNTPNELISNFIASRRQSLSARTLEFYRNRLTRAKPIVGIPEP